MTHYRPYADSEGDFGAWQDHPDPCQRLVALDGSAITMLQVYAAAVRGTDVAKRCGAAVQVRVWESHCGSYEDYQYRCANGHRWWLDGIDA